MRFKEGVYVRGARPELLFGLLAVESAWKEFWRRQPADTPDEITVTSISEGKHSRTSLHNAGSAADIRRYTALKDDDIVAFIQLAYSCLPEDFDFIFETSPAPRGHFHLEYQPKGQMP